MLLLLSAETSAAAFNPMAILPLPVVLLGSALTPMAVLPVPVVLELSASVPIAVLVLPVVLAVSARTPTPCCSPRWCRLQRAAPNGRVVYAASVGKQRLATDGRVLRPAGVGVQRLHAVLRCCRRQHVLPGSA